MQNTAVDRMRRNVVLARDVELPRAIGYDLLMDVAIRTTDVHVRARVVGNQAGVHTAPRAGHPTTLKAGGQLLTRANGRHRGDERKRSSSHHGSCPQCKPREEL